MGLCCCVWAFSSCGKLRLLFVAMHGWSTGSRHAGSVAVAHRLSCPAACGIFPDQGLNPCCLNLLVGS